MTSARLTQLSSDLQLHVQEGRLSLDDQVAGIADLLGALALFPGGRLDLSAVTLELADRTLTLSGTATTDWAIPAIPGAALRSVTATLTLSASPDDDAVTISAELRGVLGASGGDWQVTAAADGLTSWRLCVSTDTLVFSDLVALLPGSAVETSLPPPLAALAAGAHLLEFEVLFAHAGPFRTRVRAALAVATPWDLAPERLTVRDAALRFSVGLDVEGTFDVTLDVQGIAALVGHDYRVAMSLGVTSGLRVTIAPSDPDRPLRSSDLAALLGLDPAPAPIEEVLAGLGFGGIGIDTLALTFDVATLSVLASEAAISLSIRDVPLIGTLTYPDLLVQVGLGGGGELELAALLAAVLPEGTTLPPPIASLPRFTVGALSFSAPRRRLAISAASVDSWALVPDRLSAADLTMELALVLDGQPRIAALVKGVVTLAGASHAIAIELDDGAVFSFTLDAPQGPALGLADMGALIGVSEQIGPLGDALAELGLQGVLLRRLALAVDLSSRAILDASATAELDWRDIKLIGHIGYPGLVLSGELAPGSAIDLQRLAPSLGVDASAVPPLSVTALACRLEPGSRLLALDARLGGEWRIELGRTSLALTGLDVSADLTPGGATAKVDAWTEVAAARCVASLALPGLELTVGLAPGAALDLRGLISAMLPEDITLPEQVHPIALTQLQLSARPSDGTFSLAAASAEMLPLPFGNGLAIGGIQVALAASREGGALTPSGSLAGTLALGGATLTAELALRPGASAFSLAQGEAPIELLALLNGLLPAGVTLPAELGDLARLALRGLSCSFDFAARRYSLSGAATLEGFTLGTLHVARAAGTVELVGTDTSLDTFAVSLALEEDLVPGLRIHTVEFALDLRRADGGAWQWHVGGSLAVSLLDMPRQTLRADASNGRFRFSMESTPPLEWSLPDAVDAVVMRFDGLSIELARDVDRGQTNWTFEGKGGLQLADLFSREGAPDASALSGTLTLLSTAERSGFVFTPDAHQGSRKIALPLVPGDDRMTLGFAVRAGAVSLLKTTEWTLAGTGGLTVTIPEPESAESTDPVDRALALLHDMFAGEITATFTAARSGIALVVDGLPQPPVPIPVLVDGHVDWEHMGSVGLSRLALRVGKVISADGQLRLVLPPEINNVFGQGGGAPKTRVFNTEWLLSVGYDDTTGLWLQVDASPINLEATTYFSEEVVGPRTWRRFTLGDLSLRFGSFADPDAPGPKWIHVDFGELGEVRFLQPAFAFNGADFYARGDLEIVREIRIPTAPARWLLTQLQLGDLAALLPTTINPLDIDVLDPVTRDFDPDRFVDTIGDLAKAMKIALPGLPELADLRRVARAIAGQFDQLPRDFRDYLHLKVPRRFALDIAVTPATGFGVKLDVSATKDDPLKLLVPFQDLILGSAPTPIPALYGLTIRKLSFGEVIEGAMLLVAADLDIDYFDLASLAASLSMPPAVSDKFTSTPSIQKKLVVGNVLCFVVYETAVPIPIPVWFDAVGVKYYGLEGLQTQLVIGNNLAGLTLGKLVKGLATLYKELRAFFTDPVHELPSDLFSRNGLNFGVHVEPGFVRLPKYLGGGLLGSRERLFELGVDQLLVPVLNFVKHPDIGELLEVVPLEHRNGALGPDAPLELGPFKSQAAWLVSTAGEFDRLAYSRAGGFMTALYGAGPMRGNELAATLRQVATEAHGGQAREGVIGYAQGSFGLSAAQSSLDAFAGVIVDSDRGLLTQFRVKGQVGPLVSLDMGGRFAAALRGPDADGKIDADLVLGGDVRLALFGHEALRAGLALERGVFTFSGDFSLFPPPPPGVDFRADAHVSGMLSATDLEVTGAATLALAPLPVATGALRVTKERVELSLSWLEQTWQLEVSEEPPGQYWLTARAARPVVLLPGLIRVLDADDDQVGPSLDLCGPSSPSLSLSGRVDVPAIGARGAGLVRADAGGVKSLLDVQILDCSAHLTLQGSALDRPESFQYELDFQGDLLASLSEKMKLAIADLAEKAREALDAAEKLFKQEWGKLRKLIDEGVNALRAGLLESKRKVEEILGHLDEMLREVNGWIAGTDQEIAERKRILAEIGQRAKQGLRWFQDRVAEAERNLANKREELRGHDAWYWGQNDNDRFWSWGRYIFRRGQLVIETEVLPQILATARAELARAERGVDQGAEAVDQILQKLDRIRQGFAAELNRYHEEIIARRKELSYYTDMLMKSADELWAIMGEKLDSTAMELAEKGFTAAKSAVGAFDDVDQFLAGAGLSRPFEVLNLCASGVLSADAGARFSARGAFKFNFLPAPRNVAVGIGLQLDLRDLGATARALAGELWDKRQQLEFVDEATFNLQQQQREAARREAAATLRLRARRGADFGRPAGAQLLGGVPWAELADFYEYARSNVGRFPALADAITAMGPFHALLEGYRQAEADYKAALARFDALSRQNPGIAYEFNDPSIAVKRARRHLLDEVERLYKAEFTRRAVAGLPLADIPVRVPAEPVSVFAGHNFTGACQRLGPGRYDVADLTIGEDQVRSLWMAPGFRVRLYEDPGFQGPCRVISDDTLYLGEFDCKTSSIVVECTDLPPPSLQAWSMNLPVPGSPVWQPGFLVRYAVAFEYEDGSLYRGGWWEPPGADAHGFVSCPSYAGAILSGIRCDPTGRAVARRIYRQFRGSPERLVHRIANNTDTTWADVDRGIQDIPLTPPVLSAWARNAPVAGSPVWDDEFEVRYAVAYEFSDGSLHRSGWWSPTSGGVTADELGFIAGTGYACAILTGLSCDPTGQAVARRIYRQFRGSPERVVHRIANNTETTWVDDDLGVRDIALDPPSLAAWAMNLPVPDSPVWQPGVEVRYAVAYEFADGCEHRGGWWSPRSGGLTSDAFGYLPVTAYACAVLRDIPCDPTQQAVARRVYRQFRGRPERMLLRIANNTDTTCVDRDLGLDEPSLATLAPSEHVWVIGTDQGIYSWSGAEWTRVEGGATTIAVGAGDQVFVVNADQEIYRRVDGRFSRLSGAALDIAAGADGSVFVVGTDRAVYRWTGAGWDGLVVDVAAVRLAVGHAGLVYIVAEDGGIFRHEKGALSRLPGAALDIALGGDGDLFVIGTDDHLYRWTGLAWVEERSGVRARRVAVGSSDQVFVLDVDGGIHWRESGVWRTLPGAALDIDVGGARLAPTGAALRAGQRLGVGQPLRSPNGRHVLVYQDDGNLVLYRDGGEATWFTSTQGTSPGAVLMQPDGNLVVYSAAGDVVWSANRGGGRYGEQFRGSCLVVQDDGNLVTYAPDRSILWASGTGKASP